MHPEVVSDATRNLPDVRDEAHRRPRRDAGPGRRPRRRRTRHDTPDGLEWEDLMPEINRASDSCNMIWKLVDRDTGQANGEIDWAFTVGDQVKIRLVNDLDQDHPMHHPFHIHGAGRFLVLSRDGEPNPNLVWKDTVLVRANQTVDILLDVSNPGRWMAHCHIAEHNQSGMMFSFQVADRRDQPYGCEETPPPNGRFGGVVPVADLCVSGSIRSSVCWCAGSFVVDGLWVGRPHAVGIAGEASRNAGGGDRGEGDVGGIADIDVRSVGCCVVHVPDEPATVHKAGGCDEVLWRRDRAPRE